MNLSQPPHFCLGTPTEQSIRTPIPAKVSTAYLLHREWSNLDNSKIYIVPFPFL